LIENCAHEEIAYLPWSPLAGGVLSGKYLAGARPAGSRWSFSQRNGLFRDTEQTEQAVSAYMDLAQSLNCTPCQLALAWCDKVQGVTSTIIGATTMEQLKENLDAFELTLSEAEFQQINAVLKRFPSPF
jgi:aryl-alcohol dehydrogenase-like predicted oxidoreductase